MTRDQLDILSAVLIRCFAICVGFQLAIFAVVCGFHDSGYELHSQFFAITVEQFDVASYYLLGLMKILGLVLFFIPWVATRLVARKLAN